MILLEMKVGTELRYWAEGPTAPQAFSRAALEVNPPTHPSTHPHRPTHLPTYTHPPTHPLTYTQGVGHGPSIHILSSKPQTLNPNLAP